MKKKVLSNINRYEKMIAKSLNKISTNMQITEAEQLVNSSWIKSVELIDNNLYLTTLAGDKECYSPVSEEEFNGLVNASSVGSYFAKNIRQKKQKTFNPEMLNTWVILNSGFMLSCYYDTNLSDLKIKFKNEIVYLYHDVNQSVFENFIVAPAPGSFLNANIKPVFKVTKLLESKNTAGIMIVEDWLKTLDNKQKM